jgi:protein-S-isoprenylcysteine O-methyltransferase Ste14
MAMLPWPIVAILLAVFRNQIFVTASPRYWEVFAGMAAILLEFWLIVVAKRALRLARLTGETELGDDAGMEAGEIYGRMRHPRYAGMIGAVVGAGLLSATPTLWILLTIWTLLVVVAVAREERGLQRRFGAAYLDYSRQVPRFVPHRFRARLERPQ